MIRVEIEENLKSFIVPSVGPIVFCSLDDALQTLDLRFEELLFVSQLAQAGLEKLGVERGIDTFFEVGELCLELLVDSLLLKQT